MELKSRIRAAVNSKIYTGTGKIIFLGYAEIEDFVVLNAYNGTIIVGDNSYVGPHSVIYGQGDVHIGNNVLIGPGAKIFSSNHSIQRTDIPMRYQEDTLLKTTIADDVWLGADTVILGGVSIGKGAVIGAGSIVTRDIATYGIAVGNPARVIKFRNQTEIK